MLDTLRACTGRRWFRLRIPRATAHTKFRAAARRAASNTGAHEHLCRLCVYRFLIFTHL